MFSTIIAILLHVDIFAQQQAEWEWLPYLHNNHSLSLFQTNTDSSSWGKKEPINKLIRILHESKIISLWVLSPIDPFSREARREAPSIASYWSSRRHAAPSPQRHEALSLDPMSRRTREDVRKGMRISVRVYICIYIYIFIYLFIWMCERIITMALTYHK